MADIAADMRAFAKYAKTCSDEKGEAQVFCDRLFRAFGHEGYKEAGAVLEDRVKMADGKTRFADLVWKPRVVIEMKKRAEKNLARHYPQLLQYWERSLPNRPRYAILCNFDDIWVYDFNTQMDEPMDRLKLDELPTRYTALNFLFEEKREPLFQNDRAAVTDVAASKMGELFRAFVARGETRERAQRFTLQCVVGMFAEDTELLPRGLFTECVTSCMKGESSYDLIGGLFAQMNRKDPARGGRYKGVRYFNGGIFSTIDPIELNEAELLILHEACNEDWGRINPAIFGTLFQTSMAEEEQHRKGAHYTPEAEILRVVLPTIVEPWRERIQRAQSAKELLQLRDELTRFVVLDPACGSGNFLYVAYRELKRLELSVIGRLHEEYKDRTRAKAGASATIQTKQFFGIDNDPFAVELAKITLVLAKKLALDEASSTLEAAQLGLDFDTPLPLENLDDNIRVGDALFVAWPPANAIIGNPPFQSKTKMQEEFGAEYVKRVRARYKDVPGRADYCVYWFRRAHDELRDGGRAGLVGTNTIRQNFSREGGLDYIVSHGGTIVEAVSTQVWPGRAVVHVSIANWVKGPQDGKKRLLFQEGDHSDSPWREVWLDRIPTSLSDKIDVTQAAVLQANRDANVCFQGQTHGHEGFLLDVSEARSAIRARPANREVIFPYLTGDELVGGVADDEWRYVIDFHPRDQLEARKYKEPFERVESKVLPAREKAAAREAARNAELRAADPKARGNRHHENFLKRWWLLSYPREELILKLSTQKRYIACSRITRRPIFCFVSTEVRPNDKLQLFALEDDYSFGVISSSLHWAWFVARCTTLKADFNYNSEAIWDTFPWPQDPEPKAVASVESAAVAFRVLRTKIVSEHGMSLRALYASLENPGEHPLKKAQADLDAAVREAYGMGKRDDPLAFLLDLNRKCAAREEEGQAITGPGAPAKPRSSVVTLVDCLTPPKL